MKTRIVAAAAALAVLSPSASFCADRRVEYRDCPKCDKRIRVDLAAGKAYVNLSRLAGADKEVVAARAARLLGRGDLRGRHPRDREGDGDQRTQGRWLYLRQHRRRLFLGARRGRNPPVQPEALPQRDEAGRRRHPRARPQGRHLLGRRRGHLRQRVGRRSRRPGQGRSLRPRCGGLQAPLRRPRLRLHQGRLLRRICAQARRAQALHRNRERNQGDGQDGRAAEHLPLGVPRDLGCGHRGVVANDGRHPRQLGLDQADHRGEPVPERIFEGTTTTWTCSRSASSSGS